MSSGLVSVIIAVAHGEPTIGAAVTSLLGQTYGDFEAIIVSDDGRDYLALLAEEGIRDTRLTQVSTGGVLTGCAEARNTGLVRAKGDFVTRLDADDVFAPDRLARMVPIADRYGAVADNLDQVDVETGERFLKPFPLAPSEQFHDFRSIGHLDTPIVPLVRRDHVFPWYEKIDIAEDVVFTLRLVAELGELPVIGDPLYQYRIRSGSMCHGDDSAARADRSYAAIIAKLEAGAFTGIDKVLGARMAEVFARKRAFNLAFGEAAKAGRCHTFPEFCMLMQAEVNRNI
jgi:glycosyltransferase involved in cell wall biosynthesis